eukprot:TRINITY_DN106676_c0_g1_i1.p1 TRINITY_DN106676_c0_g1~~TRINITY_DN106676_c0_g1_i1.p1  ORF type:complete len:556 (+),score=125.89 TRINITY_DN106676_c0_g1_i1:26-1669(+)
MSWQSSWDSSWASGSTASPGWNAYGGQEKSRGSRAKPFGIAKQEETATEAELEDFILRNDHILSLDAKLILREMNGADRRTIIDGGDLAADTASPVWVLTERLSKKKAADTASSEPPQRRERRSPPRKQRRMDEDKWQSQRSKNQRAAAEGRALYVRGMPPSWTTEDLRRFFEDMGDVESVNLLPAKPGQHALAGFVNFVTHEETLDAAKACDQLAVQDEQWGKYELACSIKGALGQKVDMVSGFSELSEARRQKRALYVYQLTKLDEQEIRDIFETVGSVETVRLLPGDKTLQCFVIMFRAEDAARAAKELNGYKYAGAKIGVSFPKPPKKTREAVRDPGEEDVEVTGLPSHASEGDISAILESFGRQPKTGQVELMDGLDSAGLASCRIVAESNVEAEAIVKELHGHEFLPGFFLSARIHKRGEEPPALNEPPPVKAELPEPGLDELWRQGQPERSSPSNEPFNRWSAGAGQSGTGGKGGCGKVPEPADSPPPASGRSLLQAKVRARPRPTMAPHISGRGGQRPAHGKRKWEEVEDTWSAAEEYA